jgi:hypothetical protein
MDYINQLLSPLTVPFFHLPFILSQFPRPFTFPLITIADRTSSPLHDRRATGALGRFTIPIFSPVLIQSVDPFVRL